jgi:cytochrome P450
MSLNHCPPGPKVSRLEGFLLATRRRNPLDFLMKIAREYGDIAHFQVGSQRIFLLNHPDYIKDALHHYYGTFHKSRPNRRTRPFLGAGLAISEGELHRRQRRLIQPAFHKQRFAAHEAVVLSQGLRFRELWEPAQHIDIVREMKRLTLSINCELMFDIQTEAEADEINDDVKFVLSQFSPFDTAIGRLIAKLRTSRARRIHKAQQRIDGMVRRIIANRRQSGEDHEDLLSWLISAKDNVGGEMTDLQIRDEAMTFFLAGHETLGSSLAWAWYLLAKHPAAQAKLHAELDSVLGSRPPELADLPRLPYTKMVFAEALRMYPPGWVIARYLVKDYELDGWVMPAGSVVIMSQYLMHRDARYFPYPSRFDPERWTPEAKASRPQYSYFPFGGGPRGCLGEGLAWAEGMLLIALLAQRWRMELTSTQPVELQPLVSLQPTNPVIVRLAPRAVQSHQWEAMHEPASASMARPPRCDVVTTVNPLPGTIFRAPME